MRKKRFPMNPNKALWEKGDCTRIAESMRASGEAQSNVLERFAAAGVPKENVSFLKDTYTFQFRGSPSEFVAAFRKYYVPTMNAFEAAEKNDRAGDLQKELEVLFNSQNKSPSKDSTSIPATFLRVTVTRN